MEDAVALHVERELRRNPVRCHALLTSFSASTDANDLCRLQEWPDLRTLRDAYVMSSVHVVPPPARGVAGGGYRKPGLFLMSIQRPSSSDSRYLPPDG
jgi:hypothetical protein